MARQQKTKAVLFADITDSSGLYQKLGDAAASNVVSACFEALTGVLPKYEGKLIKTLGDAVLCTFSTADAAVLAAGEMQAIVSKLRPGGQAIMIHIGLQYGPVLADHDDVFGDTVNVAAYLSAVAMREQILTTDATERALSPALKSCVRPVFHTMLKGSSREAVVYQVLWKTDGIELTDVNLHSSKVIPGDTGSLVVVAGADRQRIDQWRPQLVIGRGDECDIVSADRHASRQHVTIKLMRTRFYLIDHSINGTFVTLESGQELHVLRDELPLDRSGEISLGRSRTDAPAQAITFRYDRRSMYRI
jgi:class 3 adenylate cyclase